MQTWHRISSMVLWIGSLGQQGNGAQGGADGPNGGSTICVRDAGSGSAECGIAEGCAWWWLVRRRGHRDGGRVMWRRDHGASLEGCRMRSVPEGWRP